VTDPSAQEVVDALPDGVVVADHAGTVTVISTTAATMLGWTSPAEVTGRPLEEVLRLQGQDGQEWLRCNSPYVGLRTRTAVPEQSWFLPDGSEVLVTAQLHRDRPQADVARLAISIRSGRGRARLDRERSDLVATVAHELRSPLTGVKGFVQALLNRWDKLNDEQKKLMLTTVSADADRLSRLIAELLDVARIDTGRLQMFRRPADAVVLVSRIVDSVGAGTKRPIHLDADDGLDQIFADPDKFTQVVTNLVENAVRHGEGTVSVRIRPHAHDDAPDGVEVSVTDEGAGIPLELRRRVFTKFWTGGRGGSGLGLYIVHGLVRAHGGVVTIDDAPSGGAVLSCTWPGVPREFASP
jgi:signal transduction histidine kinase